MFADRIHNNASPFILLTTGQDWRSSGTLADALLLISKDEVINVLVLLAHTSLVFTL